LLTILASNNSLTEQRRFTAYVRIASRLFFWENTISETKDFNTYEYKARTLVEFSREISKFCLT
jgi:hypothetical protein